MSNLANYTVYALLKDGAKVFEGTYQECCEFIGVGKSCGSLIVTAGSHGNRYKGYGVIIIGKYRSIYKAYKNGELVVQGSVDEVVERIGLSKAMVYKHSVNNKPTADGYVLGRDLIFEKHESAPKPMPKATTSAKEKYYQTVKHHLEWYGNTIVTKMSDYIFERLKNEGVEIKKT